MKVSKFLNITLLFVSVSALSACGANLAKKVGPVSYFQSYETPQTAYDGKTLILEQNFEDTWNALISNLARDYFVVNNVEKASRLVNVSYSTTEPEKFANCGTISKTITNRDGSKTQATYGITESRKKPLLGVLRTRDVYPGLQWNAQEYGNSVFDYFVAQVDGKSNLMGRANIYVSPIGENKTEISVNTNFILTLNSSYVDKYNKKHELDKLTINFSTKTGGSFTDRKPVLIDTLNVPSAYKDRILLTAAATAPAWEKGIGNYILPIYEDYTGECRSTGELEKSILQAAIL